MSVAELQSNSYKHWQLEVDENSCCFLTFDRADASANSLSWEVLSEFDTILDNLKVNRPEGLVIRSGKSNGFIAGADIKQFVGVDDIAAATERVRDCQKIFDKLSDLPFPTIAQINGFCLGGGLELALACDYRIAVDDPKTKLGLPEVMLGLQPGWGGTVRLPRVIGTLKAMDLMLTGRMVSASSARKMGFVDAAVPLRHIEAAVQHYLHNKPKKIKAGYLDSILNLNFVRPLVAKALNWQVKKKANPKHYPAPFAIIDNWMNHSIYSNGAIPAEATSICRLLVGSTAQNLIRIFFLRERLKGLAKVVKYKPKHIHVIGAGVMGGDIAAWCALRGFEVTLEDKFLPAISNSLTRALKLYKKKLKKPHLVQAARDRLRPDVEGLGMAKADIIIEAIIEDVKAKQDLFARIEQTAKPSAILATNTSTIPLDKISQNLIDPSRVVGIHFFNPVALMQLVEIVYDPKTSKETIDQATAFVGQIDKLPLPVKSAPGFLVNRVLVPYVMESIILYEEGIPGPLIDKAATDFGMMMGPIELADVVGLDVCIAAGKSLGAKIPQRVHNMVKDGKLGKKSGEGFYVYKNGKPLKDRNESKGHAPEDIQQRLILRMVNEAMACLREGIVSDKDLLDAGLIFGAGFAPFRGGPMQYVASEENNKLRKVLGEFSERYGERFNADEGWAV